MAHPDKIHKAIHRHDIWLSTTTCYRKPKKVVRETSCRQLNAKFLVVDNYAFDRFSRVWE